MTEGVTTMIPAVEAARTVEVVSMLGSSVVNVAHVEASARPHSRRSGYLLLGAGALLLALAVMAFSKGVQTAAANKRALHSWAEIDMRPVHQFRPERLGVGYDWMAFGGLGLGLIATIAGIVLMRREYTRSSFVIGAGENADVCTVHAPSAAFPLVSQQGRDMVVTVTHAMRAELFRPGSVHSMDELAALGVARPSSVYAGARQITVPDIGGVRVALGPVRFIIRSMPAQANRVRLLVGRFDERVAKFLALSALAHIGLLALLQTIPPDPRGLSWSTGDTPMRMTRIRTVASEPPIVEPNEGPSDKGDDHGSGPGAPGDEGTAGTDTATGPGKLEIAKRLPAAQMSRSAAISAARTSGILGMMDDSSLRMLADLGPIELSSGEGSQDVYGSLDGSEGGPGAGTFGTSYRGLGPGGGVIRANHYKTITWGDPDGGPHGIGPRVGLPNRARKPLAPQVSIEDPKVSEGLTKDIIRRYVRRALPRIQYCYERELLRDKGIAGTVTSSFLIDGNGAVIAAKAKGMGHERVESCVSEVVRSLAFPRPANRQSVQVSYPFHFRTAG